MRTSLGLCAFLLATLVSSFSFAEQKVTAGNYEIHYIVIPTTFLRPSIAHQYGLPRGKNKPLVNVLPVHSLCQVLKQSCIQSISIISIL